MSKIPLGHCYRFATQKATAWLAADGDPEAFKLIQGRCTDKWNGESYLHAWVEIDDRVFDWQTSFTQPDGLPRDVFYDYYQPEPHRVYTAEEAVMTCLRSSHWGPWGNPQEEFDADGFIREAENIMARWAAWWQNNPHAEAPALVYYFMADGKQYMTPIDPSGDVLSQMVSGASDIGEGIVAALYLSAAKFGRSLAGSLNLPNRGVTLFVRVGGTVQIIEDKHLPGNVEPTLKNPGPPILRKRKFQEPWEFEPREVTVREALIPGAGFVEAGIAHVIERLNELGMPPLQSSSGLSIDGSVMPGRGYIAWLQSDLTPSQIVILQIAAEAAGLTASIEGQLLYQPDLVIRTDRTHEGDQQIQTAWDIFLETVEAQVTTSGAYKLGGDPYAYAFLLVHNDPTRLRLLHGTLNPPDAEPYAHAWAESTDGSRVYDWALAQQYPQGVDAERYYSYYRPVKTGTYSSVESFLQISTARHPGPWKETRDDLP